MIKLKRSNKLKILVSQEISEPALNIVCAKPTNLISEMSIEEVIIDRITKLQVDY